MAAHCTYASNEVPLPRAEVPLPRAVNKQLLTTTVLVSSYDQKLSRWGS